MKVNLKTEPREFKVGSRSHITLADCGAIHLDANEQVTFVTEKGSEYDVCRKEWGFYATPSMNDRLKRFGFKTALVKNIKGQLYIMIVENDQLENFQKYIAEEDNYLVQWLDEEPVG